MSRSSGSNSNDQPSRQALLRQLAEDRELLGRQRRRTILLYGLAISLVVHLCIMWYLALVERAGTGGPASGTVSVEFATITDEELTQEALDSELEDLLAPDQALTDLPETAVLSDLSVAPPAAQLDASSDGAMESLGGGGGGGEGLTLGGGGANATFFGVRGTGNRIVYIADYSGSMSAGGRMRTLLRELATSVASLPDYVQFHVILFNHSFITAPDLEGWARAQPSELNKLIAWLDTIAPTGGTDPVPAFVHAMKLDPKPDVIFFMTDGIIPPQAAPSILNMLASERRIVVHTIAFGETQGHDMLRQISTNTGGDFRYVPEERRP